MKVLILNYLLISIFIKQISIINILLLNKLAYIEKL